MPKWSRVSLQVGNFLAASGVAWARVEGERHFPTDVLAGAALGHMLTRFMQDIIFGESRPFSLDAVVHPGRPGGMLQLSFDF